MVKTNKIGLVFSGGGGKGAYQIGVWKALEEFGVADNIQGVSGTSVGALNAALFLQNDLKTAEEVWQSISPDKILSLDAEKIIEILTSLGVSASGKVPIFLKSISDHGIFKRDGLEKIIDKYLDINYVSNSSIPFYATCCRKRKVKKKVKYFKLNNCNKDKFKSIMLATSAIPIVFGAEEIDGKKYIDGGCLFGDNKPVKPLYDEGFKLIFLVHLKRRSTIDRSKFPNTKIIEVFPQNDQGGIFRGTLNFNSEVAMKRMKYGYKDMKKILEPIYEMAKTQRDFNNILLDLKESEEKWEESISERERLKDKHSDFFN